MDELNKIHYLQRLIRSLYVSNSAVSEVLWACYKHMKHDLFVAKVQEMFNLTLEPDDDVSDIVTTTSEKILYTPFSRAIDDELYALKHKLNNDIGWALELKDMLYELVEFVHSHPNPDPNLMFSKVSNLVSMLWGADVIYYHNYPSKKNSNCLHSIMSLINASICLLAGINNSYKVKPFTKRPEAVLDGWCSLPAVIVGQNASRKSQMPIIDRQQELFEMTEKNLAQLTTFAEENETMFNIVAKNFVDANKHGNVRVCTYIADVRIHEQDVEPISIYEVDHNGFGLKEDGVTSKRAFNDIQFLLQFLDKSLTTCQSKKIPNYDTNTVANLRVLSRTTDESGMLMKLSITQVGKETSYSTKVAMAH